MSRPAPDPLPDVPEAGGYVYLLCFAHNPYRHAAHYLGATGQPLHHRLAAHQGDQRYGRAAVLLRALHRAGGTFELADVWPCASPEAAFQLERQLKRQNNRGRLCGICHPGRTFRPGTIRIRSGAGGENEG